jgi:hypothetical protein
MNKIDEMSRKEFASHFKKAEGIHTKGDTPCGNCNLNQHKNCRPRLDDTLCSCSCPKATNIREAMQDKPSSSPTVVYNEIYRSSKKVVDKN